MGSIIWDYTAHPNRQRHRVQQQVPCQIKIDIAGRQANTGMLTFFDEAVSRDSVVTHWLLCLAPPEGALLPGRGSSVCGRGDRGDHALRFPSAQYCHRAIMRGARGLSYEGQQDPSHGQQNDY